MTKPCLFSSRGGLLLASVAIALSACGAPSSHAEFPPVAKRWYDRGTASYKSGDLADAELAAENALRVAPSQPESRLLAGRIALARLDYDRTLEVLKGLDSNDARALRGRALWYRGDVERAADELDALLRDPDVRDDWALDIVKLARRGVGRKPFELGGSMLAATEMGSAGAAPMLVALEIDGQRAVGMIATGTAESIIDAAPGTEPSWVSLGFRGTQRDADAMRGDEGPLVEVRDVPVLAKDLTGLKKQMNADIKILLGVNLLRHLHPTIDLMGGQFVVRNFEPPPPPDATTVPLAYARGGGMLVRGALGSGDAAPPCSLLIDTSLAFPVALAGTAWTKAGVPLSSLQPLPNQGPMRAGVLPTLQLGAFDVPQVPGLEGDGEVKERAAGLGINIDGLVGSGLLGKFRVTLVDGGRSMWLEDLPADAMQMLPPIELPDADADGPEGAAPADAAAPANAAAPARSRPGNAKDAPHASGATTAPGAKAAPAAK